MTDIQLKLILSELVEIRIHIKALMWSITIAAICLFLGWIAIFSVFTRDVLEALMK